jgi:hypothetical protein
MAAGTDAEKREAKQQIVSFENQPKKYQRPRVCDPRLLSFHFPPFSHFCKDQLAGRKPNPGRRWQHLSIV